MLERLAALQVRALADKAQAARQARDKAISGIRDEALGEPRPARGVHNPAAALGLNVVPEDDPRRTALEAALAAIPPAALRELWALVLVGRGDFAVKDWERAMSAARQTDVRPNLFMEQANLHEYLMKGVYELERE